MPPCISKNNGQGGAKKKKKARKSLGYLRKIPECSPLEIYPGLLMLTETYL